jgi:transcriptional regulator with AAA-type ATPase domain
VDLPWNLLEPQRRNLLESLVVSDPPETLAEDRWSARLEKNIWMLDPILRAWGRGYGAHPSALASLMPPSLALGDPLLHKDRDSSVVICSYGNPQPCDNLAIADPFHWLEQGMRAMRDQAFPAALTAFMFSHAHFARLKYAPGIQRAAGEAAQAALLLGDLPSAETWRRIRGTLEPPRSDLEDAELAAACGDRDTALALARKATKNHPDFNETWILLLRLALLEDRPEDLREALAHLQDHPWRSALESHRDPGTSARDHETDPVLSVLVALKQLRAGSIQHDSFWKTWEACPDEPLRLETGLCALEGAAETNTPTRLLTLRKLADRNTSATYLQRLEDLWPSTDPGTEPSPEQLLKSWMSQWKRPLWLTWGPPNRPSTMGVGTTPPPELLDALRHKGAVGPLILEPHTWWGFPLRWEGTTVGSVLTAIDPRESVHTQADLQVLAPWLSRLTPLAPIRQVVEEGCPLLTDGSEPMASLLTELTRVATSELPVLVQGPTGSGKELVAREIHIRSGRKGPFVPINCSEYVETLMESELFGHVRGAFTGADRDRKGAIEMAEGGTLFLDEVADLGPRLQSLFLRVLQEKEMRRVGGEKTHKVNVRFLAATHRPLDLLVASGHFRKDLHYRLKGVVLTLPSLHERSHEFPYLIPRLTARVAKETGLKLPELAPGLPLALARLPWPGNIRELRHAIERALLRANGTTLKVTHFPELETPTPKERGWEEATRQFQRQFLLDTLERRQFQITEASRILGITRPALYLAAKRLQIDLVAEKRRWETNHSPLSHSEGIAAPSDRRSSQRSRSVPLQR